MIGKRINPDKDLEYLLGNTDSKGRDRTSEVVGGGNLMVIMHMRKYARGYREPSLTYVYREKRPLSEIGGIEFEERLKECILKTFPRALSMKSSTIYLSGTTIRTKATS